MIEQARKSFIKSRKECNPYCDNGLLPIITAPMNTVVNEFNYELFINNKVHVCLPRTIETIFWEDNIFIAMSLNEFIDEFLERTESFLGKRYVCIDTANGNMSILHDAIIAAKAIHGKNLIIMAGNIASINAFMELAKTGVDYIRVGIGGSNNACTTTKNIGIGQIDLWMLIHNCYQYIQRAKNDLELWTKQVIANEEDFSCKKYSDEIKNEHLRYKENAEKAHKVKIVADGISTYIKQCQERYGFNDNGYAAINTLLNAGADLIMIGSLFAQCLESSSNKYIMVNDKYHKINSAEAINEYPSADLFSEYYGMSTIKAQALYKPSETNSSEGSISYLPIKYRLSEWLYGGSDQDNYPYLCGWVNSIKSAMSYTNSLNLKEFCSKEI